MIGRVYLVGAGPGDPELLTVKALRILRQADLVLHDDLVPAAILAQASPDATVLNVGKRCGKKSISQEGINARMVAEARQGLSVVRLKGGDPSIFGRSGEEIEALRDAEVEFEVVPGVTAASAAAAAVGISLTHRHLASSVTFLTGHHASDHLPLKESSERLGGGTVVVYMPGPDYKLLHSRLLEAGIGEETPCVLVTAASAGRSSAHRATVGSLPEIRQLPGPNILIVGRVTTAAREAIQAAQQFGRAESLKPWEPGDRAQL
jgi:uroporphyrin-III C-methyltransferase